MRARGGGLRRAPDRRLQHDPRHQGGVDRARPRSARVRAVRLRRQRAAVRLRHGARRSASAGWSCRRRPGLFSSFGLLYADVEHHYARTFRRLLRQADLAEIDAAWDALARQATAQLAAEGFTGERRAAAPLGGAALQGPELRAHRAGAGRADRRRAWWRIWRRRSGAEHERTYGHRAGPEEPVELVSIQVVGQGLREGSGVPRARGAEPRRARSPGRRAGPISATRTAGSRRRSCSRSDLATSRAGPLIVEEYDATCVVPPGAARRARRRPAIS